jgi:hypothetical protein
LLVVAASASPLAPVTVAYGWESYAHLYPSIAYNVALDEPCAIGRWQAGSGSTASDTRPRTGENAAAPLDVPRAAH